MKLLYIGVLAAIVWSYICWSLYKAYLGDPIVAPPPPAGACSRSAGLDRAALLLLPVFVYSSAGGGSGQTTTTTVECAVCLAELKDGERGRVLPLCGHVFHRECIDLWFDAHSTCPICRAAATVDDPDACGPGAGRNLDRVV